MTTAMSLPSSHLASPGGEDELHRNAQLNALGLLAGGIAHDFNNLLTVINVHLGVAQQDAREPGVQAALAQIEQAVGQAKHLARQILQFSRQQNPDHQLVRLPALVTAVLGLLRPTWPATLDVLTDLPPDAGWVMACPTQLHQVLTNLLVNAVHAMEYGPGRLEVRVDSLVVEQAYADPATDLARGRYVRLTVSDSGRGMDADTQRRIFEPFFTTKAQGTGLGLAIVHRILQEHGACIRVSSEPGRGTTFRIYFLAPSGGLLRT